MSVAVGGRTEVWLTLQRRAAQRAARTAGGDDLANLFGETLEVTPPGNQFDTFQVERRCKFRGLNSEPQTDLVVANRQSADSDFEIAGEPTFRIRSRIIAARFRHPAKNLLDRAADHSQLLLLQPQRNSSRSGLGTKAESTLPRISKSFGNERRDYAQTELLTIHRQL